MIEVDMATGTEQSMIRVELGERSYPIYIGPGLLQKDLLKQHLTGRQVCVVTNTTVAPLYLEKVRQQLVGYELTEVVLPDGEEFKTLETLNIVYNELLGRRFDRHSTVVALGGGVIGDMAGYVAATYLRGVSFIQIPTTLLSQVDSSVGGKTGVNHPLGKNMIGAFYQPKCVLIDTDTLVTLPDRELKAGLAEVIKYGLINNRVFFDWLNVNLEKLLDRDSEALTRAIKVSCQEKASIVALDERETGIRAWLNLGHTFGHAIENVLGYGSWLHGEAVATGMVMAADLSQRLGYLSSEDAGMIKAQIKKAGLPVAPPESITIDDFWNAMGRDKKNAGGKIRFILLESIGKALLQGDLDTELVEQTMAARESLAS